MDDANTVTPRFDQTLRARLRWTTELVIVLAPRELRTRYRQSALDIAWALITPVTVACVYGVVLTSFNVSGNGVPYLSMAWCGLVLWTFTANAVGGGVSCMISFSGLVTKVYFPREALPLSIVGASFPDLGIGLITVAILLPIQGVRPGWVAVTAVLPIAVLILWVAAATVMAAVVAAFIRDVPHLVSLVLRVGFFATPVMYDAASLPPAWRWSAEVSPVAASIDGFRDAVLRGRLPNLQLLSIHLFIGAAALVASILYTRSVESRITDAV